MPPIAVRPYRLGRSFDSFEAAIRHAESHPLQSLARRDADRLQGAILVDAWWTDAACGLRFDSGLCLLVRATPAAVRWRIVPADTVWVPDRACRVGAPPVVLDWAGTVGLWPMDLSALIAKRRGAALYNLFVNEFGLLVYLRKHLILHFGHAERVNDGGAILYVFEED